MEEKDMAYHLIRKTKEDEVYGQDKRINRKIEFGTGNSMKYSQKCTMECDEETFEKLEVGRWYQINIEAVPTI
jgi:hypothetical protein